MRDRLNESSIRLLIYYNFRTQLYTRSESRYYSLPSIVDLHLAWSGRREKPRYH